MAMELSPASNKVAELALSWAAAVKERAINHVISLAAPLRHWMNARTGDLSPSTPLQMTLQSIAEVKSRKHWGDLQIHTIECAEISLLGTSSVTGEVRGELNHLRVSYVVRTVHLVYFLCLCTQSGASSGPFVTNRHRHVLFILRFHLLEQMLSLKVDGPHSKTTLICDNRCC